MIITVVIFALIAMIAISSLVGYAMLQIRSQRQAVGQTLGISIAEAAIEAAIWKLNNQLGYSGESGTAYGSGVYNVTVSNQGNNKLIKAEVFVPNAQNPQAKRIVQVTASNGSTNIAFNYGVHVGVGGLEMENNSRINGNVYSNDDIEGSNGSRIAGTAVAAGSNEIDGVSDIDGDATARYLEDVSVDGSTSSYSLDDAVVGGNAVSDSISDCTIGGNATFDTKSSCTIGGSQFTPNPNSFVNPSVVPLPISDQQIDDWEDEAEDGGVVGTQTISGSVSLGPKKISGNLTLNNGAVLTVTGTIWVTGTITLSNGSTMQLSSGYGSLSGVVLAGTGDSSSGIINAQNGSAVLGSGTAGSYLMLLSQRDHSSNTAITVANNATGGIFYAGRGVVVVANTATTKEITAEKIHLNQNAVVTYESGLASAQFSSGPAGGWEMLDGTWQLLQ
ncbi:MAG: hypothetical protein A3H72_01635 [Candidatus Doudnabacteria bacterium RIFCSPLOWO2_02_FULL_48_8]|uniref:Type 4 fimbrial biogenesis protein PilX N-terminal domain-containing protein n=1 Tax=Candidatus Doudnabacteria bacterium RIFCSPHIGHO2_01_FULL_46_24 TaxID=1817825 RepID=A0A1F5NTM2_9BACT|nr:MAG: hypothetical protein A2720_03905 [Candidatus Doudnabacteria bacterium RIFCSPHIGHO2_01_FULL_46_24]OGE94987.1 MAG: hypothetical protein A3H72_01635 [Candidatus Doudnabacteria bacterium RIFCSPLOWO2_02_FULL_48_8]